MICILCQNEFKNSRALSMHLRHSHKDITSKDYYDLLHKENHRCVICNKEAKFINLNIGYSDVCSLHCARIKGSKCTKEKYGYIPGSYGSKEYIDFIENKYGVDNIQKNKEIREKSKNTTKEHYGVEYAFLSEDAKQKAKENSHAKEIKRKIKENNLNKYGYDNPAKTPEIKYQIKQTIIDKHMISDSDDRLELSKHELKNASKIEKYLYDRLKNHYTILYNASSKLYPYLCDFYIVELDLYIELNITWTHGFHYYTEDDIDTVERFKNKNSSYYDNAIYIWTIKDIEKRNCAVQNNLNYVVLWNKQQINQFINDIQTNKSFIGFIDYNSITRVPK